MGAELSAATKKSRFPETQWSLVGRAGMSDAVERERAVARLLAIYRPALRVFLVETRRIPQQMADDILHDFVADRILAKRILERANSDRGRFRNFLVKSLSNFASTQMTKERGRTGPAVELQEATLSTASSRQDTDRFDRQWVRSLVTDALQLMEEDCRARDRMDLWDILVARAVDPILHDAHPVEYDVIVERFGLETPRQAINLLATAKRAFLRHLRTAVGRYVDGDARIDEEIADLKEIVGR
jgi:hypothetical protein